MVQLEHEPLQLPVGTRTPCLNRTPGSEATQEENQTSVCSQGWAGLGSFSATLVSVILLLSCFCNGGHAFSTVVTTLLSASSVLFCLRQLWTAPCALFAELVISEELFTQFSWAQSDGSQPDPEQTCKKDICCSGKLVLPGSEKRCSTPHSIYLALVLHTLIQSSWHLFRWLNSY